MKVYTYQVIIISPVLPCVYCDQLTDTVLLKPEVTNPFYPLCPAHCYTNGTPELEQASIVHFVLWMHKNKGSAHVVVPCKPLSVPGYVAKESDPSKPNDLAWHCKYRARTNVSEEIVSVIFSFRPYGFQFYRPV